MEFLHKDRERFPEAINLTEHQTGIMAQIIEKDYYVTMILRLLADRLSYIVFKGGTSLSKCHKAIKRFSEDIDLRQILNFHRAIERRSNMSSLILLKNWD